MESKKTGGCLCGAVCYEISGEMRNIVNCHCSKCRKFHGHYGAYSQVFEKDLNFIEEKGLKWFESSTDETPGVQRGFCSVCGSSLFWHPKGWEKLSVAAGSLDDPGELTTSGHIWLNQKNEYYTIDDDLPQFFERWGSKPINKNKDIG